MDYMTLKEAAEKWALKAAERVRVDFEPSDRKKRSQGLSRALRWSRSGISRLRPCAEYAGAAPAETASSPRR